MPTASPPLTLADQIVLLTLDSPRRRVAHALQLAGLPDLGDVVAGLEARGLITRSRLTRHPDAVPGIALTTARRRLNAIVRQVIPPTGANAELLLLVALAGGLDQSSAADHLGARHRIADLTAGAPPPGQLLAKLMEDADVATTSQLADELLPARSRLGSGGSDPPVTPGVWGGWHHGGGTLG